MTSSLPERAQLEARKERARIWFERLRDDICSAFEELEHDGVFQLTNFRFRSSVKAVSLAPGEPTNVS